MSFGLTFDKLIILALIAAFLLGPDRLPHYASQLARLVRSLKGMASGAKERLREEIGPDFDDVDWKKLDPRQYDPKRIIREALTEEETNLGSSPQSGRTAYNPSSTSPIAKGMKPRDHASMVGFEHDSSAAIADSPPAPLA